MSVHETASPASSSTATAAVPASAGTPADASAVPAAPDASDTLAHVRGGSAGRLRLLPRLRTMARMALVSALSGIMAAGLVAALIAVGLYVAPSYGVAAYATDQPPRRPPIVPPSVPLGAREDWAIWTYVYKINEAWGKDWPLVIQWFEELDARYPGNPMVLDKLYVSYLEDGRRLQEAGDLAGARLRYDQASQYDPDRGIAQELLDELDALEGAGR